MEIYAQEGIDPSLLQEQHEVLTTSQNTAYYTATYDERLVVNMPFWGKIIQEQTLRDGYEVQNTIMINCLNNARSV